MENNLTNPIQGQCEIVVLNFTMLFKADVVVQDTLCGTPARHAYKKSFKHMLIPYVLPNHVVYFLSIF